MKGNPPSGMDRYNPSKAPVGRGAAPIGVELPPSHRDPKGAPLPPSMNPGVPQATGERKTDPSLTIRNEWQGMRQGAIDAYKGKNLGYNPYQTQAGPRMEGMNYNPYRQAATNQAQAQAGNQLVSQQSQLQKAGGLSGSDRMKMFSDFNRSKIQGTLGANQQYDQLQSQNQLDVDRFNSERDFNVSSRNVAAGNEARQFGAMADNRRDLNLYQDALQQRNLDRQLEASRIISQAQMKDNYSPGIFEKMLEPIFKGFDTIGGSF